jgi:hypothetical protein
LFEYNQPVTAGARADALKQLSTYLLRQKPRVCIVIPNELQAQEKQGMTNCWAAFDTPDSAAEMRGTFFEYAPQQFVMPVHSRSPTLKVLQLMQQRRFYERSYRVAYEACELLTCEFKHTEPGAEMLATLYAMVNRPLAIDIENIESRDLITAIGVSDGRYAVSVPWAAFVPHGRSEVEPGWQQCFSGPECREALRYLFAKPTVKYLHNHTFDVPRLAREGLHVAGEIHDTFAAHAIAFPELRHGLQHAAADMMAVRPWKSAWHPKLTGITREDEEFWSCDPLALRDYNCDDCFHTWHLAQRVLPCVGVSP